ncbi:uncharacterized protein SPSC_03833 [Sporisorium scitamineum]|uniref:Uncharacterized protein n=1 Tax=Sporisorium scitamineum TaxID=49012 RepID=A0A127Z4U9_9BASI|nr:uncharacterized protein SPSC_03833 [Sporisorium scitamineum]
MHDCQGNNTKRNEHSGSSSGETIGVETNKRQARLNLKFTLFVDWFGPHKGKFHEWHSTGALLLRIDNLLARLTTYDRRCLGIHLVGLLPGPKDTTATNLQKYLQLVDDELKDFDDDGKVIQMVGHPDGKLVKARLHLVVTDTPARAKVAGFALKYWKGTICAYCPKQGEKLGLTDMEDDDDSFVRIQHHAAPRMAAGFRPVAIDRLTYFNAVNSCPPDMMHAIHLGLCKRFWHRFLIESCNEIGKRLPEAQLVIANALLPTKVQGPNKLVGSCSGGNPTAEQREVLFRVLLPFVLMQLWSESLSGTNDDKLNFAVVKLGSPRSGPPMPPMLQAASQIGAAANAAAATATAAAARHRSSPPSNAALLADTINVDDVLFDGDAEAEDGGVRSDGRQLLPGPKGIRSVFRSAMLLCSIVELVSGDLIESDVNKLADYITKFNHSQAKLLGPAWMTFNNHNVSHLPHFIRLFGSPRHFSSLPFEHYNGLMGTIPTSGHKGGTLEATIMCNAAQRTELRQLLAQSSEPFFETRLLGEIEGPEPPILPSFDTRLKKRKLDNASFGLLLAYLNRRAERAFVSVAATNCDTTDTTNTTTSLLPRYTPSWDTTSLSSVARLDTTAEFIHTTVLDQMPDKVKMFMHVHLLEEVSLVVLGSRHPSLKFNGGMGIQLMLDNSGNYGEELVVDVDCYRCQLTVVPFTANSHRLLGLKML